MNRIFSLFCFSIVFVTSVFAQDLEVNLERDASKMIDAIVQENYDAYIRLSYPPSIDIFGGKEMMVSAVKENKSAQKSIGMVLTKAGFDHSSKIVKEEGSLQSIVAFNYILEISGKEYKGQNYLLAISTNEGENWTFVELETFDESSIKDFVSEYSDQHTFPTHQGARYEEKSKRF